MEQRYVDKMLSRIVFGLGCWEWDGAHTTGGYAETWDGTRPQYAHRMMYEHERGPIPEGLVLDHLCRNRGCVRPNHMEPVTDLENRRRGTSPIHQNPYKTHCPRGHPYDEKNTYNNPRGHRICRACRVITKRAWLLRRKQEPTLSNIHNGT